MAIGDIQEQIMQAATAGGSVRIADLAQRLAVSDETIRRHVRPLVERGMLTRSHGTVRMAAALTEAPFHRRLHKHAPAKRAIAHKVAELVEDGMTLMIDTGSTTAYVAEALAARQGLRIITNGIEIARALVGRNDHRVYLAGGELKAELAAAVGPEAMAFIEPFRADLAILSIAAIDLEHGLMNFEHDEARIARLMMASSARTLVAADASKLGARAVVQVASFDEIAIFVTDQPPPSAFRERLASAEIHIAAA